MIQLKDKEFRKLSELTGVPDFDLQKLYMMGLLDQSFALNLLMKRDYQEWMGTKMYTRAQIIARLCDYYNVSDWAVVNAIKAKKHRQWYCSNCGRPITYYIATKNDGVCDRCKSRSIEI